MGSALGLLKWCARLARRQMRIRVSSRRRPPFSRRSWRGLHHLTLKPPASVRCPPRTRQQRGRSRSPRHRRVSSRLQAPAAHSPRARCPHRVTHTTPRRPRARLRRRPAYRPARGLATHARSYQRGPLHRPQQQLFRLRDRPARRSLSRT